jgi:uncharacterized protein (UPF0276 family)
MYGSNSIISQASTPVGIGLRHQHYEDVLRSSSQTLSERDVDFIEVHAENFYGEGGRALSILKEVASSFPVSIHGTSLGLGSVSGIPSNAIQSFKRLIDEINPKLISDHASFSWGESLLLKDSSGLPELQHSGDLLPIVFNKKTLNAFIKNVDHVQQVIGRQLLIENVSSYLALPGNVMAEFEFLQEVCHNTGSGLLVDINNIYVTAFNQKSNNPLTDIVRMIDSIEPSLVKEIHLAGCSTPQVGELMIDDHSQRVDIKVWQGYEYALIKFGRIPTLIEWDNQVPSWSMLTNEAFKAKSIARRILKCAA